MFRPLPRHQLVGDIVAAALLFVGATFATLLLLHGQGQLPGYPALLPSLVLTAVFAAALAIRRLSPPLALAISWAVALVQMLFGVPPLPGNVAIFGVLYAAAAHGTRRLYWTGFASTFAGGTTIAAYILVPPLVHYGLDATSSPSLIVGGVLLFASATLGLLLAWTIGALVRMRLRARQSRAEQLRAEGIATVEQERTRIARDMHDVVAHSLAVVIAQADGARYAAADDPEAAAITLGTISTTARSALSDVRVLLTQLRHSQADGPQPTLADLEHLFAQVRGAGVDLHVDVAPTPHVDPPAATQLAVYRILQEALTNALRHGDGGLVEASLAWHADRVDLTVRSSVAAPVGSPDRIGEGPRGHGIIGMRERAQLVGGALEVGASDGEFVVRASLPTGSLA